MLKNGEHIYLFELVILNLNDKDNLNLCFPLKNEIVLFSDPLKIIHFPKLKKKSTFGKEYMIVEWTLYSKSLSKTKS